MPLQNLKLHTSSRKSAAAADSHFTTTTADLTKSLKTTASKFDIVNVSKTTQKAPQKLAQLHPYRDAKDYVRGYRDYSCLAS
jgi:hypothetical protein